jgi:hypothetical protein
VSEQKGDSLDVDSTRVAARRERQPPGKLIPAGGLPPAQIVEIAHAPAEALAAGIIHPDLKPANRSSFGYFFPRSGCFRDGRRPFQGQSSAELAFSMLRDSPSLISDARPGLPADLVQIVGRCLEKDPNRRIQTACDIANQLAETAKAARPSSGTLAALAKAMNLPDAS